MSFSRLRSFLTAGIRRQRFEDTLDEEVRFHLHAYTDDLTRSGVPRREAMRRARIHFGGIEGVKDDCLLVGHWTLQGLGTFLPAWVSRSMPSILEPAAVWFTMALSLATGFLFGLYPALHATRAGLVEALKDDAGQPAGARAAARFRDGLVKAQFALAMTLLVGAGMFIQSLRNVSRVDLGIRTENVVTFRLAPDNSGYSPAQSQACSRGSGPRRRRSPARPTRSPR